MPASGWHFFSCAVTLNEKGWGLNQSCHLLSHTSNKTQKLRWYQTRLQQLLGLIISAKFKPFILINPPAPSLHLWMWSLKYAPLLHKTWHDSVFYCTDPSLIRQGDKWIHASLWVSVKANTRKKEHAPVVHPLWRVAIQLEHIPKGGGGDFYLSKQNSIASLKPLLITGLGQNKGGL